MSFTKGHKRRPTSIAADEILKLKHPVTPTKSDKSYKTADGQILQSSMVKSGSPTKRQITGSHSQVRFSLPPQDGDEDASFDEDIIIGGLANADEEDDFDNRSIFNLGSRALQPSFQPETPRGRSSKRNSKSIGDSMRELLNASPDRKKLFIRGDTNLNHQSLPIPLEISLPPMLSPDNKDKKRPSSLVYNGVDYEPLEHEFIITRPKSVADPSVLSKSISPVHLQKKKDNSPLPKVYSPSRPTSQALKQIDIPNLEKPYRRPVPKVNDNNQLDNEKIIENPSQAAKEQNNQLNKRFSFPSKPPANDQQQKTAQSSSQEKSLPRVPPQVDQQHEKDTSGLGIYNNEGPMHGVQSQPQSSYGRFAFPQQHPQQHQQHQTQPQANFELPSQRIPAGHQSPTRHHYHRRSQSRTIDFPVDKLSEVPTQTAPPQQFQSEPKPIIAPVEEVSHHYTEELDPPMVVTQNRGINDQEDDQMSFNSIQESFDIDNSDIQSIDVESILSHDTTMEQEDDPNQLLDLGRLIINSRSTVNLNGPERSRNSSVSSAPQGSRLRNEVRYKVRQSENNERELAQSTPEPESVEMKKIRANRTQPLGSQHLPQVVKLFDNFEPDRIRQISNYRIQERSTDKQISSALSQSSYESEISEPFSATSSNQTADTAGSIHNASRTTIDLTNDNYGIVMKKADRSPLNDGYRSIFENIDGQVRETIVLDDDESEKASITMPLNIRHKKSKSALGNLEFEKSSRAFSNFSFETVASEVQLHYKPFEQSQETQRTQRQPLSKYSSRTYTEKNKTAIELCDDTMQNTKEVLEHLKRQRTLLLNKQNALMSAKKNDENRLSNVRQLQANLMKTKQLKPVMTRPKSYVYGEDPVAAMEKRQSSNPKDYYDYVNNRSYDFETFMRTQSSSALV